MHNICDQVGDYEIFEPETFRDKFWDKFFSALYSIYHYLMLTSLAFDLQDDEKGEPFVWKKSQDQ